MTLSGPDLRISFQKWRRELDNVSGSNQTSGRRAKDEHSRLLRPKRSKRDHRPKGWEEQVKGE